MRPLFKSYFRNNSDKILHKNITLKNGINAILISGTLNDNGGKIRIDDLVVIKESKLYYFTAGALDSTWNNYKDLFEESLLSFE